MLGTISFSFDLTSQDGFPDTSMPASSVRVSLMNGATEVQKQDFGLTSPVSGQFTGLISGSYVVRAQVLANNLSPIGSPVASSPTTVTATVARPVPTALTVS